MQAKILKVVQISYFTSSKCPYIEAKILYSVQNLILQLQYVHKCKQNLQSAIVKIAKAVS